MKTGLLIGFWFWVGVWIAIAAWAVFTPRAHAADDWGPTRIDIAVRCGADAECRADEMAAAVDLSHVIGAATDPAALNAKVQMCAVTYYVKNNGKSDGTFFRFADACIKL